MKKTRKFQLINPTLERWDIYEKLIPALDKSYGLHADAKVLAYSDRRIIDRYNNLLTIEFHAETEEDFYNIDYEAIAIYTKAGLAFKMISCVSEVVKEIYATNASWQLEPNWQNFETWDKWMEMLKIIDSLCGVNGIRCDRKLYPELFSVTLKYTFTDWLTFSDYNFFIGRVYEKYNIPITSVNLIPESYQANLFDDILELTDTKRVRAYA